MRSLCLMAGLVAVACASSSPGKVDGPTAGGSPTENTGGSGATDGGRSAMAGSGATGALPEGGNSTGNFTAKPLGSTKATQGYQEYLPDGYGDGTKRPLIVFVHGLGENGDGAGDLSKILGIGIGKVISSGAWPASRPFVVLAPQHRPNAMASGLDCTTSTELHDFIDYAVASYDVDSARVYIAALSCGAIGSWNYLGEHVDEQVAAAVLVAGDGRPAWTAQGCKLARVGIWAFHGTADATVPPAGSTEPMAELMACPQPRKDQRLTTYPGVGHESWVPTYEQPDSPNDIYGWMLGITR